MLRANSAPGATMKCDCGLFKRSVRRLNPAAPADLLNMGLVPPGTSDTDEISVDPLFRERMQQVRDMAAQLRQTVQ